MRPSYHNDGSVCPPDQLFNVMHGDADHHQRTGARRRSVGGTRSGAAGDHHQRRYQLKRDHEIGSLAVGKYADLVELAADIYTVPVDQIVDKVTVLGTWLGGKRIDLDNFLDEVKQIDPTQHGDLTQQLGSGKVLLNQIWRIDTWR